MLTLSQERDIQWVGKYYTQLISPMILLASGKSMYVTSLQKVESQLNLRMYDCKYFFLWQNIIILRHIL